MFVCTNAKKKCKENTTDDRSRERERERENVFIRTEKSYTCNYVLSGYMQVLLSLLRYSIAVKHLFYFTLRYIESS